MIRLQGNWQRKIREDAGSRPPLSAALVCRRTEACFVVRDHNGQALAPRKRKKGVTELKRKSSSGDGAGYLKHRTGLTAVSFDTDTARQTDMLKCSPGTTHVVDRKSQASRIRLNFCSYMYGSCARVCQTFAPADVGGISFVSP